MQLVQFGPLNSENECLSKDPWKMGQGKSMKYLNYNNSSLRVHHCQILRASLDHQITFVCGPAQACKNGSPYMADDDHPENLSNRSNSAVHRPILLKFDRLVHSGSAEAASSSVPEPEVEMSGRRPPLWNFAVGTYIHRRSIYLQQIWCMGRVVVLFYLMSSSRFHFHLNPMLTIKVNSSMTL